MGTTRSAAGGMENFVKIDREYVLAAAAAARVRGVKQRLLYVSVSSPVPHQQSNTFIHGPISSRHLGQIQMPSFPTLSMSRSTLKLKCDVLTYPPKRSKGLTEEGLAKLGYDDFIVFRPGFLKNRNNDFRLGEHIALYVSYDPYTPYTQVSLAVDL